MAGVALACVLGPVAYSLGSPTAASARRGAPAMQYSLNNYPLPGPLSPVYNQALVKLSRSDETTTGGLFLAAEEKEKPREGVVVEAGPGRVHPDTGATLPTAVKSGDLVLLGEFAGEKVDYNGASHQFVSDDGILGTFKGGVVQADTFCPLRDRLLVRLAEAQSETSSGIALATGDDEAATQGEVVAAGPGRMTSAGEVVPVGISAGEHVLFGKYAGADVSLPGGKFKVVHASDCLAKW
mmetsp:Transcript_3310/g.10711  ORF Transcript_3310/g.10711 Transcript_3310/m.10711 type:complete len:239 (+) Transcript_3310:40-756(+)|eukprot:CAMPEP_0196686378 /NCGR_PEP_ID=MMETSP1090-20130531/12547_1 /TAXON_ID=37098 /ORGANISM="Isochrysis sp, Strain CCMP1244" /LENGTH=238 /DNA_ID=CAMNT_0042024985 /DNA_START=28 /DNA_END=741 /DNA_ORIENTATION=+